MMSISRRPFFIASFAAAALAVVAASNVPPAAVESTVAPDIRCATPEPTLTEQAKAESRMMGAARRTNGVTVTIPIYWHVINRGSLPAEGNVSSEDIQEQIDVLNASYAGDNGGAETQFRFTLAGLDRTTNETWYFGVEDAALDLAMKTALKQGGVGALNIYSVRPSGGLLGRSTFPWNFTSDPVRDGILIRYSTLPNGVLTPYNLGDTLVHEVGHWLGLYHTFSGKCNHNNDFVADTPAEKYAALGCPEDIDSCPGNVGLDPVENYMDYTDDSCMFEFTPGQAARMAIAWDVFRD